MSDRNPHVTANSYFWSINCTLEEAEMLLRCDVGADSFNGTKDNVTLVSVDYDSELVCESDMLHALKLLGE